MRVVGFSLLLAGWGLVLAAIVLLPPRDVRAAFVLAGLGVEALGFIFVVRSHVVSRGERA